LSPYAEPDRLTGARKADSDSQCNKGPPAEAGLFILKSG